MSEATRGKLAIRCERLEALLLRGCAELRQIADDAELLRPAQGSAASVCAQLATRIRQVIAQRFDPTTRPKYMPSLALSKKRLRRDARVHYRRLGVVAQARCSDITRDIVLTDDRSRVTCTICRRCIAADRRIGAS